MQFPAWSRAVSAQGTVKQTPGAVNVAITIGDTEIEPGDVIVADSDGVVRVRRDQAETVLAASRSRDASEDVIRQALQDGQSSMDLFDLRQGLADKGFIYVDNEDDG
jgi:4-hydroxy-4-methyl-2-oxoglutarate aldolase